MDAGSAKAHRSTTGCWTCKLRRKKCDERHPACDACTVLQITCHFGPDKPQWLDGGVKQEDMLLSVKRDVRRNAPYRQVKRKSNVTDTLPAVNHTEPAATNSSAASAARRPAACRLAYKDAGAEESFEQSDTMLLMFYLEHVFPFLFPFYRPPPTDGGKAWVLEMILNRPVLRRATLCQSAYFFAVINGTNADDALWNAVLARTRDSYDMLRRALHVVEGTRLVEHVHGAVRILAGIIQVQRFENVALSFTNSRTHLDAALTMFQQLLDLTNGGGTTDSKSVFEGVVSYLGNGLPLASSEQAAFRFSTALLLFDDIIASTATPAAPRLYELHRGLLTSNDGCAPPICLESVVGCHNSIMLLLGEISTLDAWKQRYTEAASLDVMALVQRATAIKSSLLNQLMRLEAEQRTPENDAPSILQLLTPEEHERLSTLAKHKTSLNRVWAHAALLYLHTVVSGWQRADVEVAHHVSGVIDLLIHHDSPSILVRSMVWPFCVAGCLAQQEQEVKFREVVERLQPRALFRTVHQALEIMEGVWRDREIGVARRDLAECLQDQGELILLI